MQDESQLRGSEVEPAAVSIVIVGAGTVGLALARTLAAQGIDSVVLEKNDHPEAYSRAILIPPRTLDIFEGWKLADGAKNHGIFTPEIRAYAAESGKVAITIDFAELEDVSGNAGFLFLPQDRTEALLLKSVQSSGRSKVLFGTTHTAFSQDPHGVTVEAVTNEAIVRFRCQYMVGCDGAHSAVRKGLALPLVGKTYRTRVLIADIAFTEHTSLPTPRIALKANGPLVMLRFDDTRWRIVGTVDPRESDEAARSKQGVAARVRMLSGDRSFNLLWSSTFQIHNRSVQRLRVQRVFLAGDAAHLSSPAGGMGMNSGIEDAYNLGWKLAAVLRGADKSLLDSYESERLYAVNHSVERTSDIASKTLYFAPYGLRLLFMGLFNVAMQVGSIRRKILSRMTMIDTRYPASEFSCGDRHWFGRIAPDHKIYSSAGVSSLFHARRGKPFLVCHDVAAPVGWKIDTVTTREESRTDFERAWTVATPFAALIRPDGVIAWAKQNPSTREIEAALDRTRSWLREVDCGFISEAT
jgi:2-polyprenyl-6-methoxyphenol hydroxylase-like FAD-dependent oxidoreductase